jgi:hypothetical protein
MTVRSHAVVMPLEAALSVLAVSTLGLWVLSVAVEDRRIDRRRRAVHAHVVHDLSTGRVRHVDSVDGVTDVPRRVRP